MIQKSSTKLHFLPTKPSLANCVTTLPLKRPFRLSKFDRWSLASKEALSKLILRQLSTTSQENYQNLTSVWPQGNICTLRDFLCWYNNKDVVPTQQAMQKIVDFYNNKRIDMLKLGYILQTVVFTSQLLQKFIRSRTAARFYWRKYVKTWWVDYPL